MTSNLENTLFILHYYIARLANDRSLSKLYPCAVWPIVTISITSRLASPHCSGSPVIVIVLFTSPYRTSGGINTNAPVLALIDLIVSPLLPITRPT
jgi:hypothetical protein